MNEDLADLIRKAFLGIVAAAAIWFVYQSKVVAHVYAGEDQLKDLPRIVDADPITPSQVARGVGRVFAVGDFTLRTLAEYDIHGIVVKKAHSYYDGLSSISWSDIGIGYGAFLTDPALLGQYRFFENERFLWARPKSGHEATFEAHLAEFSNNHLIFATKQLEAKAEGVREGRRIRLRGYLVAADNGRVRMVSSLTRDDTGPGACEILFVTDVKTWD